MIDTIELSALMRQGTSMDQTTADRIAQAILKAHADSPPITREYLDKRLAELESTFERGLRTMALTMVGTTIATIGLTSTIVGVMLHFKP